LFVIQPKISVPTSEFMYCTLLKPKGLPVALPSPDSQDFVRDSGIDIFDLGIRNVKRGT
jgi:hypothetical protein